MKIKLGNGKEVELLELVEGALNLNTGEVKPKIPLIEKSLKEIKEHFDEIGEETGWSYTKEDNSFEFGIKKGEFWILCNSKTTTCSLNEIRELITKAFKNDECLLRRMTQNEIVLRDVIKNRNLYELSIDMLGGIWVCEEEVAHADYIENLDINTNRPYSTIFLDEGVIMINNNDLSVEYYEDEV